MLHDDSYKYFRDGFVTTEFFSLWIISWKSQKLGRSVEAQLGQLLNFEMNAKNGKSTYYANESSWKSLKACLRGKCWISN